VKTFIEIAIFAKLRTCRYLEGVDLPVNIQAFVCVSTNWMGEIG
jgi:hypothetical protein